MQGKNNALRLDEAFLVGSVGSAAGGAAPESADVRLQNDGVNVSVGIASFEQRVVNDSSLGPSQKVRRSSAKVIRRRANVVYACA